MRNLPNALCFCVSRIDVRVCNIEWSAKMHERKLVSVFCLVAMHTASGNLFLQANAEDAGNFEVIENETIVVSGTRIPTVDSTAFGITADDIAKRPAISAVDILRNQQDIVIVQPSNVGRAELSVQGAESNFTVVLVDGVRVNNPTNSRGGSFDFTTISPGEIERVDVLKGAYSSVYGSDALSGVINIITKGPGDENAAPVTANVQVGDDQFINASGTVRIPGKAALTMSHSDSGNEIRGTKHALTSIQGKFKADIGGWNIRGTIRGSEGDGSNYPDASGGQLFAASDALEVYETDTLSFGGAVSKQFSDIWSLNFETSYSDRSDDINTPAIFPGVLQGRPSTLASTDYSRANFSAYSTLSFSDALIGVAGLDVVDETGETTSVTDFGFFQIPGTYKDNRTTFAGFVEGQYEVLNNTKLHASVRVDSIDEETEPSWHIGVDHQTKGPHISLKYAESFKAPSFYALGDGVVGNSLLSSEEGKNLQLSVSQSWRNFTGSLNFHDGTFTNLIDFDFATFKLVNRGTTDIRGAGGSLGWISPNEVVSLKGHASYVHTEIDGVAQQITGRPEWTAGLLASWKFAPRWEVSAQSEWVGDRPGNSVPTGPRELEAFDRQDLKLEFRPKQALALSLSATNFTDNEIEEAAGFISPGATLRFGISVNR